jgi:large subunit ribosomal protein L10
MALTKDKKYEVVKEVTELLSVSKMTVAAKYQGTTVKAMQHLRRTARDNGTVVKVIKNRLIIKALQQHETFKDIDVSRLNSMLVYAFNSDDEVAPAQILANFAKANPTIEFVGAFTAEGKFIDEVEVKALADLPSKPQLLAGVINTLQSPLRGVVSGLSGNLHGLLQALEAKAN